MEEIIKPKQIEVKWKWKTFVIVLILYLGIFSILGSIWGYVNYNYEVNKCLNMKSSNYNFNVDAQINAEYAQNCYYYLNYPLALFFNILGLFFGGLLIGGFIGVVPFLIWGIKINDNEDDEGYSHLSRWGSYY